MRIIQKRVGDAVDPAGELRIARFDLGPMFLEPSEQIDRRQIVASARQLFADGFAFAWVHGAVQLGAELLDMLRVGRVDAPVFRSRGRIGLVGGFSGSVGMEF